MIRKIIQIDEEKCNGCGACATACHEGAIEVIDGKAKLTREDYCDGFGDCLPNCPTGAITFTEREAPAYDEAAVLANKQKMQAKTAAVPHAPAPEKQPHSTAVPVRECGSSTRRKREPTRRIHQCICPPALVSGPARSVWYR